MIFLSYSSQDKERVRPIAESLAMTGYEVWWDEEIPAGRRFEKEIEAMLERCSAVVSFWSEASIESEWVYEEADFGKRRSKLVPVFIDDCTPPMGFRMREGARLENWNRDPSDIEWQGLLRSLEPLVGVPKAGEASSRPASSHEPPQEGNTRQGYDLTYDLSVSLEEAYFGKAMEVQIPGETGNGVRQISVQVPAGIETGSRLRVRDYGDENPDTGEKGDLYLLLDIADHPVFERRGSDLYFTQTIDLTVAILGGEIEVKMIDGGLVRIKVPPGTQPSTQLRLRGKGMSILNEDRMGDAYLEVLVEIPRHLTKRGEELIREFANERVNFFDGADIFETLFGDMGKEKE